MNRGRSCCSWAGCLGCWNPLPPQVHSAPSLPWEADYGGGSAAFLALWLLVGLGTIGNPREEGERGQDIYSPGSFLGVLPWAACLPGATTPTRQCLPYSWLGLWLLFFFFFPSFSLGEGVVRVVRATVSSLLVLGHPGFLFISLHPSHIFAKAPA